MLSQDCVSSPLIHLLEIPHSPLDMNDTIESTPSPNTILGMGSSVLSVFVSQSPRFWLASFGIFPFLQTAKGNSNHLSAARGSILSFLQQGIVTGHLYVEDPEGILEFGTPDKLGNTARIKVLNKNFWARIFL